jgi:hypothetical protein
MDETEARQKSDREYTHALDFLGGLSWWWEGAFLSSGGWEWDESCTFDLQML